MNGALGSGSGSAFRIGWYAGATAALADAVKNVPEAVCGSRSRSPS